MRTNFKEIDMGMSSLETVVSLWDIRNGKGGRHEWLEYDDNWYRREVYIGANYLSGPVTVINFDYLENN